MSFQLPTHHPRMHMAGSRSGTAMLVEAMVLLVFLTAALAVFMQMFSLSLVRANESRELTTAVAAASDVAERFAAYPEQAAGEQTVEDMRVVCNVVEQPRDSGVLYRATIDVYAADDPAGEPIYFITTANFESEVG